MKVLMLAPQPFYSPRGTPLSVYYRALIMAELGVEIDLLTYGEGQDVTLPGVRIIRIPKFSSFGRVQVGPSYLKAWLDIFLMAKAIRLLLTNKYHGIHAHEEAVFFCLLLKPLFRIPYIYDMHSSLPQQLTNFQFTRSRLLIKSFEKLERAALRSADAVITICEDLYHYADSILPDRRTHVVIENSLFEPVPASSNHKEPDAGDPPAVPAGKRLVVYAGTLEPYQGIDLMLRAFQNVVQHAEDVCLLVAGGTKQQVTYYSNRAAALGIPEHCVFTGTVSKSQAQDYMRKASVVLSPRITGDNTPLKIYEQLASGIPLVATDIRAHTQVLSEDVAFLVAPEPDALAAGILEALEATPLRAAKIGQARHLYRQKYSRARYKQKMQQVLDAIC